MGYDIIYLITVTIDVLVKTAIIFAVIFYIKERKSKWNLIVLILVYVSIIL